MLNGIKRISDIGALIPRIPVSISHTLVTNLKLSGANFQIPWDSNGVSLDPDADIGDFGTYEGAD